ncbi:MAG: hypothetical protein ABJG78_01725 [Cyclobacteriaceae bacterium]
MLKKKFLIVWSTLLFFPLLSQSHLEIGINYLNASHSSIGLGAYLEPRYALSENLDLGLRLGLNGFIGEDQSRTKSSRVTTGTLPLVSGSLIRRFLGEDAKGVPYVGLGPGLYLSEGINFREGLKLGAGLRFGFFIGRSNIGFTHNFVPEDSFFQLSYGFRLLDRGS